MSDYGDGDFAATKNESGPQVDFEEAFLDAMNQSITPDGVDLDSLSYAIQSYASASVNLHTTETAEIDANTHIGELERDFELDEIDAAMDTRSVQFVNALERYTAENVLDRAVYGDISLDAKRAVLALEETTPNVSTLRDDLTRAGANPVRYETEISITDQLKEPIQVESEKTPADAYLDARWQAQIDRNFDRSNVVEMLQSLNTERGGDSLEDRIEFLKDINKYEFSSLRTMDANNERLEEQFAKLSMDDQMRVMSDVQLQNADQTSDLAGRNHARNIENLLGDIDDNPVHEDMITHPDYIRIRDNFGTAQSVVEVEEPKREYKPLFKKTESSQDKSFEKDA